MESTIRMVSQGKGLNDGTGMGRHNYLPGRMAVAESIKCRLLEAQWDNEQFINLALARHQKNRK
ncbi:MAG: hypothetical protein CSYNP_01670 [Syntrophus sp. SKADARSKE-3]|nr:hypothetical protein [Syntrophus sp. SKADARSKE-3]